MVITLILVITNFKINNYLATCPGKAEINSKAKLFHFSRIAFMTTVLRKSGHSLQEAASISADFCYDRSLLSNATFNLIMYLLTFYTPTLLSLKFECNSCGYE